MRDLFYATPARLKFMKSERAETAAIGDVVKRLALAKPEIAFTLTSGDRTTLRLEACAPGLLDHGLDRLGRILGEDFVDDALPVRLARGAIAVEGFAGLPTLHRPTSLQQYLVVNGRPVRDKLLAGSVRAAYGDLVPNGRHPMLALFLTLPPDEVDVNVHPAKTELRFRDAQSVRAIVVSALREALGAAQHRATASLSQDALARMAQPVDRRLPLSAAWAVPLIGRARPMAAASASPRPLRRRSPRSRRQARHHRGERRERRRGGLSRWARRGPRCMTPSSSPRPTIPSSSSTSTRPMSASSMSA